jgi:hypothetical protein
LLARVVARCAGGTPWVDAQGFGIVLDAEGEGAADALVRLVRCAASPERSPSRLEEARSAALAGWQSEQAHRAMVGQVLAPAAPAWVAVEGTLEGLAAVASRDLEAMRGEVVVRARASLGIVGPVPVPRWVELARRAFADMPQGTRPSSPAPVTPTEDTVSAGWTDGARGEAVLVVHAPGPSSGAEEAGARGALGALEASLVGPAIRTAWRGAGVGPQGAWMALALHVDDDVVEALPARLAAATSAASTLTARSVEVALDAMLERRSSELSSVRARARLLAVEDGDDVPTLEASLRTSERLLAAPARWLFARPRSVEVRGPARGGR